EQALWKELRVVPSETTRELMEAIRTGAIGKKPVSAQTQDSLAQLAAEEEQQAPQEQDTVSPELEFQYGPLPLSLNKFYGREAEIEKLIHALSPHQSNELGARLITLVGPGGAGKTRLSLEVARRLHEDFDGAIWFVRLAGVASVTQLQSAITEALSPQDSKMS